MTSEFKWEIPKNQQIKYIQRLTAELAPLRAKVGVSQGDLAKLIGVSRQTYSSIECENRMMSWNTFLSLILFFDCNQATHKMLRTMDLFPEELVEIFNAGKPGGRDTNVFSSIPENVVDALDDAAFQAIRTVIMFEYARCSQLSGEAVIRAFDGISFEKKEIPEDVAKALNEIKRKQGR